MSITLVFNQTVLCFAQLKTAVHTELKVGLIFDGLNTRFTTLSSQSCMFCDEQVQANLTRARLRFLQSN